MLCPYCRNNVSADRSTAEGRRLYPFCSRRCKLADLGAWASGGYSIPVQEMDENELQTVSEENDMNGKEEEDS